MIGVDFTDQKLAVFGSWFPVFGNFKPGMPGHNFTKPLQQYLSALLTCFA